jgi:hypothetical protein
MAYESRLLHDTTKPYETVDYHGIEYTVCRDFDYISRYKRLRQVIHYTDEDHNRFIALETQNGYDYSSVEVEYYIVPNDYENRLDLIAYDKLGAASYAWVIAYLNNIEDGYTVLEGQTIMIPKALSDLFKSGCVLSSVPATSLNLGTE